MAELEDDDSHDDSPDRYGSLYNKFGQLFEHPLWSEANLVGGLEQTFSSENKKRTDLSFSSDTATEAELSFSSERPLYDKDIAVVKKHFEPAEFLNPMWSEANLGEFDPVYDRTFTSQPHRSPRNELLGPHNFSSEK